MGRRASHLHRMLALLDSLFAGAALVIEADHRPTVRLQVGDDEPHAGEQLPGVKFDLRYNSPRLLPTLGLVEKAFCASPRVDGSACPPAE